MMKIRILVLASMLLATLTGCAGGAFGGFGQRAQAVTENPVTQTVRFYDKGQFGPEYQFSLTLPEEWLGNFEIESNGSVVTFNYVTDSGRRGTVFEIYTLSFGQYWAQNGSYPTLYKNLLSQNETYFAYSYRLEPHYSGLSDELYAELIAQVPDMMTTFEAELIGTRSAGGGMSYGN